MTFRLSVITLVVVTFCGSAATPGYAAGADVQFSVIRTGHTLVRERLTYADGSFSKKVGVNFVAILVKHGENLLLFDSGLGTNIADQYRRDMPWWARGFFGYEEPVSPVRTQLDRAGVPAVPRVILSHSHWDHASGLTDFPEAEVWAAPEELEKIRHPESTVGGAWPSQVGPASIRWKSIAFDMRPYQGFDRSLDVFQDGSVVLVPLYGHTPGSVGMFVTVASGKQYFFCGDAVWNAGALKEGSKKPWTARKLADFDADQTQESVEQIRRAQKQNPGLTVVPAHDGTVQDALGYFPQWVR